jgi:DNA polymerase III sliding clamp (beta) subunit (PCNA family)
MSVTPDLLEMPSASFGATEAATVLDFVVERRHLDKALARVAPVVPSKDLMPVLKNFHFQILELESPGNWAFLRISGSDSVLSAVVRIPVKTTTPGGAAVFPAALLLGVVREASGDTVHVQVREKSGRQTAVLRCGKAQWTMPLMSAEGFPDFTAAEQVPTIPVNRADFLNALNTVRRAASQDVMRPYLMMVDVYRGRMRASDSVRFHESKRFRFPFDCQIPTRAAHEVAGRLAASTLEEVGVAETDNALLFRFGVVLLICQKIAAQFPDVDEVLLKPAGLNDLELIVDRAELLAAVRRVRLSADDTIAAVALSLNHNSVSVECKDRKGGFAVEEVPAEWPHAPRHVAFNHQYLTDLLASITTNRCVFRLGKDLKTRPSALLVEDPEAGFTAVLAQIRLDWL